MGLCSGFVEWMVDFWWVAGVCGWWVCGGCGMGGGYVVTIGSVVVGGVENS